MLMQILLASDFQLSSVQFSRSVMSDSLRPHESQHARPPCPSPTPGVRSDSRPLSQWWHPAISSSIVPFSSCPNLNGPNEREAAGSESERDSKLFNCWLWRWRKGLRAMECGQHLGAEMTSKSFSPDPPEITCLCWHLDFSLFWIKTHFGVLTSRTNR